MICKIDVAAGLVMAGLVLVGALSLAAFIMGLIAVFSHSLGWWMLGTAVALIVGSYCVLEW